MLGERESTLLFACCVTRRTGLSLSPATSLVGCARVGYWFFQVMPMLRYNLPYGSLQGALAAARSKTHSAEVVHAWFALHRDSRCTAGLAAPSYCRSMRV